MPKLQYDGLTDFSAIINTLESETEGVLKMAVYDGAHQVFKALEAEVRALPESKYGSKAPRDITPEQKAGLLKSLYGSRIQVRDGGIYEYISFTGYNDVKSKKYPHGQPNIMIARSIESGATYMNKRPFVSRAAKAARGPALDAAKKTFDAQIKNITK